MSRVPGRMDGLPKVRIPREGVQRGLGIRLYEAADGLGHLFKCR